MLQKFRAARAAAKPSPVAHALTPAPPAGPATVDSLGQQLREVLPTRRLQSVSLCDHEANVLWLSEGALGPDEHMLVMEALEALTADSSLPCHETALEDGRLAVFLPVRTPTGALVGVAMILADSKSVGDDTLERLTAAPVRTIMQRLAVLLKPSGMLAAVGLAALDEPEEFDAPEALEASEAPEASESAEPLSAEAELALVTEVTVTEVTVTEVVEVSEVEITVAPVSTLMSVAEDEEIAETIITAAEIAKILELELAPDELSAPNGAEVARAASARAPVRPAAAAPAPADSAIADSGMLRLEFLVEPPVVRPAPNPTAVAKKLHAASKAAEVAPTRGPRPLPAPPAQAARPSAPVAVPAHRAHPAPAAKGKTLAPAATPPARTAPAAPPTAPPAARNPAPAPGDPSATGRHPFEPMPPQSHLSLSARDDDVVVLFESEPVTVPARPGAPARAPAAAVAPSAPPAKPVPTRIAPTVRIAPPTRSAPQVRFAPQVRSAPAAARPQPTARTSAPAPAATPAVVAPAPTPVPAPAAAAPVLAPPPPAPVPAAASAPSSPPIDLVPFAKLRAGGQTRRFQVQPRASASQRDAAAVDERTLQQLLAWLAANRALWNDMPTSFTVNLSIATLEDERFLQRIGTALNTHGIAGETLGFEIAESLCAQERAKVERFITQCEKLGAWIAIDDFSFDSQVLPLMRSKALRLLKLDARLTAAALRDKLSQAMVVATVQAAKVLGIHCSAKKADSHASLQYLTAIGLDFAQGAALSRPVPLEAIGTVSDARPSGFPLTENNE